MLITKDINGLGTSPEDSTPKQRRNRLLLIGIDEYRHWGKLQYPVKDCVDFFQVLKTHYGFREHDLIQSLYNEQATADILFDELYRLQELDEDGNPRLGPEDNLILYFSGHGHLDKSLDEGYWAPVDAPVPVKNRPSDLRKLVSVSEVVKILSQIRAHHILLIVDACFSGAFTRMAVDVMPGGDPNNPEEKPSRWVLTAGQLEPVPDKSEFAEALRHILSENDRPRLSIQTLGATVKDRVTDSGRCIPSCISLVEQKYEGGEFFFHRRTAVQRNDQVSRPKAAIANLPERLRQGSATHLERLKKGRFKHLNIIQLLLTGNNLPGLMDTQVKSGDTETPLQQAVQSLWGREKPHPVVLGEGGMGKTVSLVRLWQDLLEQQPSSVHRPPSAIPVFVALNEYNAIAESEKYDFVLRSIARNCGLAEALNDDWKNALWDLLKTPLLDGSPSVLLLLDGFNEVTVKKDQLLIDLNRLSEQAKGMQMVITSRYVEIQNFTWAQHSEVIELLPLSPDKIKEYLQQINLPLPKDEALQKLFGNPMMLTLYAGASSIAKKYEHDKRFRFLPTGSYGELLWNFNEAQLARHLEDLEHDPDEQAWHCFLLRCLVPRLAYTMELEGQFFVPTRKALNPTFNFKTLLDEAFTDLNREELTEVFPGLDGKRSLLGLGEISDLDARERRTQRVQKYLVDKLHLMVAEDEALRFVHQNFRDFFAAVHLRNAISLALAKKELPEAWRGRPLPVYLRRLIGEIEGEQYFDAQKILRGEDLPENWLVRLLKQCRGNFEEDERGVGFAVWNVLSIWYDVRETLAGGDLTWLDLRRFVFNEKCLNAHQGAESLSARFRGSLLDGRQFIFEGHFGEITCVCYNPNGKKVLSASTDGRVKEWSVETGTCLQTLKGHINRVNTVCYSPDGKKVLSASEDTTVKEWSVENGSCLQILEHSDWVFSANYSPDGKKVLSASMDGTVKEWLVETGICLQTLRHPDLIWYASYSPDGKKVLYYSNDGTIKEWSIEMEALLQIFQGHSAEVNSACYSHDGKKVLSASDDGTIKEWLVETGACLQTLQGHDRILSACYSSDGKKVLSISIDWILKEWLIETGACLQTLQGYNPACYSPDGKKVLSFFYGHAIKEWSVDTGVCLQTLQMESGWLVRSGYYGADGKKVLSASEDDTVKEWSVEMGVCLQILKGHSNIVTNAVYSPDEKKILSVSYDQTIKEWSVETGACLQTLQGHSSSVISACYSSNGKKVLSFSHDGTIKEWSVETGACLHTLQGHSGWVRSACYNPDEKKILSAADDRTIKEWSVETGDCLQTLNGHSDKIWSACYNSDGNKVLSISADGTMKEWSVETGVCLQSFQGNFSKACYSADGEKVLTTGMDGQTVKEWSVETGICLRTFKGAEGHILFNLIAKNGQAKPNGAEFLEKKGREIEEKTAAAHHVQSYKNEVGLLVQACDFRHLHPSSHFTEEEKSLLRMYGAIFSDEDERRWNEAVADAYADLVDDEEPEIPPHP